LTPEDVLKALVAHAAAVDFRKPDPLVMAARESKVGKTRPTPWWSVLDLERGPSIRSAKGHDERRISTASLHEIATDALIGMPKNSWNVVQTSIGMTGQARDNVTEKLLKEAWKSRKRDRFWPDSLNRKACPCHRAATQNYVEDLVELALLHLEHPIRFGTHDARAEWFGLSSAHWRRTMLQPYDVVSRPVWAWYKSGLDHIKYRLALRRRQTA
jgi:hypothetical protein